MSTTQVVVIGAGPGGYAAAFYAADLGMQVALVDPEANPGGVCLYRGCIPSKALLHVAAVINEAEHAAAWGVSFGSPKIDVGKVRAFKEQVVSQLTGGVGQVARLRKINYIQGTAAFRDPGSLEITLTKGGTETLQFEHAVIATGSRPAAVPGLSIDSPRVMDSTAALDLPDVPKSLLVVGGGYIGLELGTVYAALGSKVTVVEMTDGLLPGADRDLVNVLAKRVNAMCEAVLLKTKVVSTKEAKDGIAVTFEGELPEGVAKEQTFDRVLVSVGRKPNSAVPGLEKTKVKVSQRGFIEVDEARAHRRADHLRDRRRRRRADARAQGVTRGRASRSIPFTARKSRSSRWRFPRWSSPTPSWRGAGSPRQRRRSRIVKSRSRAFPWAASGRAITLDRTDGMTKLVIDPKTERILGVGIVGPGAGELISEGVLAIEMGTTAADLRMTIHPHPTLSETLMESAEVFFGQSTHVYKPKRK